MAGTNLVFSNSRLSSDPTVLFKVRLKCQYASNLNLLELIYPKLHSKPCDYMYLYIIDHIGCFIQNQQNGFLNFRLEF